MTRRALVSLLLLLLLLSGSGFLGVLFRPRLRAVLSPMELMGSSIVPGFQLLDGSTVRVSRGEAMSLQALTVQSSIPEPPQPSSAFSQAIVKGRSSVIMPAYN